MSYQLIETKISDGIGYLIFNNPATRNAFSPAMVKEICEAICELRYNSDVRVIVLRGSEGNFCGGADVSAMKEKAERLKKGIPLDEDPRLNTDRLNKIVETIRASEKPVVAWLEGAVAGAGMSVAMACDFSFADENCKMVFAFVNIALVPDMGAIYMLTRRVGLPKATELFMTGKRFSGSEAAEWGIITAATSEDKLQETVMKTVNKLKAGPPLAYEKIKKLLNRAVYSGMENSMINEMEYQNLLNKTQDHLGAIEAFLNKKAPEFTGK